MSRMDILQYPIHNVSMRGKVWRHKITRAGQVSVPAEIRERWGVTQVIIRDEGDRIVMRPASDNPLEALRGLLKGKRRPAISATDAIRQSRRDDNVAMDRKWRDSEKP